MIWNDLRQPEFRPLVRRANAVTSVPPKVDCPGRRREQTGNLIYQRGFSGTVRPDDRVQFADSNIERHAVGYDKSAEVLVQSRSAEEPDQARPSLPRILSTSPSNPPRANRTMSTNSGPNINFHCSVMPPSVSSIRR